jgi:hypothetical protein
MAAAIAAMTEGNQLKAKINQGTPRINSLEGNHLTLIVKGRLIK